MYVCRPMYGYICYLLQYGPIASGGCHRNAVKIVIMCLNFKITVGIHFNRYEIYYNVQSMSMI